MYIASISSDVRVHTWPHGQLVHTYKSNIHGSMKSVSWGKDGCWLVLVPSKGPAEVISVKDNLKHLHSVHEIQQPTCAAFQNNTKRNIALGTTTGTVLVYDIKSKNVRKHFPKAPSTIFKIEYCAKDSFLVAACENGEALLYNSVTFNLSCALKVPNSRTVSNIRCHQHRRNLLIGGSQEGVVALWDIHTSKLKYHNQAHTAPVTDLVFSPLRGDLIVTIGLDRKFVFFDTSSDTCIMQKIMDKSCTAIDFCPDGIGLAVATQDGTIHTYDTRQMNNPLYSFVAHSSQIKQLLFQKKASDDSCDYSFPGDKISSSIDNLHHTELSKSGPKSLSYDSFGYMFCGDILPDIPEVTTEASSVDEVGDSFINALGLSSQNVISNSMKQDNQLNMSEGVKKLLDNKTNLLETSSTQILKSSSIDESDFQNQNEFQSKENLVHTEKLVPLKTPLDIVKGQSSSTPKIFTYDVPMTGVSPIIANNQTIPKANTTYTFSIADLHKIVREAVKEEMKLEMECFKQQLKYEFMDVTAHMRRHFLDLQMSIVKEFVQMETNFNRFKEDIVTDECFGEEILVQENMRLRKELATLRDQIISHDD